MSEQNFAEKLRIASAAQPAPRSGGELTQREIDVKNLRFYAGMAREQKWNDEGIIHWTVIEQTLLGIAQRIESQATPAPDAAGERQLNIDKIALEIWQKCVSRTDDANWFDVLKFKAILRKHLAASQPPARVGAEDLALLKFVECMFTPAAWEQIKRLAALAALEGR